MAIVFFQKKSRENYLAAVLFVLVLILIVIVGGSFARKHIALPQVHSHEVHLNTKLLESPALQNLVPLPKIPRTSVIIGRIDPFSQASLVLNASSSTSSPNLIK